MSTLDKNLVLTLHNNISIKAQMDSPIVFGSRAHFKYTLIFISLMALIGLMIRLISVSEHALVNN